MVPTILSTLVLLASASTASPAMAPGRWDVTSTVAEVSLPGVPGFIVRMIRGKSKAEHKRLTAGQGVEALIAPDPKAQCHVDSQRIEDGRYSQALTCPQKKGAPLRILRAGTFDASGFAGRASITGTSPKGPMSMVLTQRAVRIGN
ncbi:MULTISPECIES: DUF3617 family protein [unclassified Sphingomonas]|uniref:DUF3617 domain-containing protein n=1 Tax=unclassified Sphingomonas TaxID=196159 RepID=UPI002269EF58|nr:MULTISPECIES: DUF3617 family protein [unclassified Sphingomonas]